LSTYDGEFTEYFVARAATLRRLGYMLCGDWNTADDLVQVTFLKLLRRWHQIRDGSIDAYARRVLINSYLSQRRDGRREIVVEQLPDRPDPGGIEPFAHSDVAAVLARLPARQRAAVVLRYVEDLPVAEVAELLGMAEGTVKSQTARGVDALRRALVSNASPTRGKE
jgi:RNA polymerase sigma-70 factor (sigma-E family)